jgi:hypothetical protein
MTKEEREMFDEVQSILNRGEKIRYLDLAKQLVNHWGIKVSDVELEQVTDKLIELCSIFIDAETEKKEFPGLDMEICNKSSHKQNYGDEAWTVNRTEPVKFRFDEKLCDKGDTELVYDDEPENPYVDVVDMGEDGYEIIFNIAYDTRDNVKLFEDNGTLIIENINEIFARGSWSRIVEQHNLTVPEDADINSIRAEFDDEDGSVWVWFTKKSVLGSCENRKEIDIVG